MMGARLRGHDGVFVIPAKAGIQTKRRFVRGSNRVGLDPPCSLLQEGRYPARVSPAYWAITILEELLSRIVLVESNTGATDVNV